MSARTRLTALVRNLFRARTLDAQLDEELRAYVDDLAAQKMRAGLDRTTARRAALLETGGVEQVKERVRDARTGSGLDTWFKDVRYALRGLRRSPGFTVVAVLTLALGVGANVAIFSVVDAVLLRPAPVQDLDRLAVVWETDRQSGTTREPGSLPDLLDFRQRVRTLAPIGALAAWDVNMAPARGETERLAALLVSPDLLPTLGFAPVLGRPFTEEESRPGGPNAVLISESLWTRLYGRNRSAIGSSLRLDDKPFTVVGVVPDIADFGVLQVLGAAAYARAFADRGERVRVDAWVPLQPDVSAMPRETHPLILLGKTAPGATMSSAQQELTAIAADLERAYPVNKGRGVHVEPLREVVFGPVRPALNLLLGSVFLVLVIACVNVANLLLARGTARKQEVAIRSALGAGGARLIRQFFVESLVLAAIAACVGVGVAYALLQVLVAAAPADIPRLATVALDVRVLALTLALCLVVGCVFALVPALQARQVQMAAALGGAGGDRTAGARHSHRRRAALVVAELSLAVTLLAAAGLLVRSFWQLQHVDAGFRTGGVLKAEYQLPASRYPVDFAKWPDFKEIHAFDNELLRRAATLPGVVSVALAGNHPIDPGFTNSFQIAGREAESRSFPEISVRRVSPGYFTTVGPALVAGRLVDARDTTRAPAVLNINEAAAKRFFPRGDAIGAKIRFWGSARTIVGVVANERSHGLSQPPPIAVYAPVAQAPSANGAGVLLVRAARDPEALVGAVRRLVRGLDPELAVFAVEPLDRTVSRTLAGRRFVAMLLALFAVVALALAAVGIHGVLAYSVTQRRREFGVRMALGARPADIVRDVLREVVMLFTVGMALGTVGTLALSGFLAGQLFGVTAADPLSFGAALAFLAAGAAAAGAIPAWHATKVDPVVALRAE
jgi:putative ABC transport system permease protein